MNEKRFYWIKLKTDFFEMPEIDWLQEQENGCEYIVLYQKLCLLAANTGGELIRQVGTMMIPYDVKKIAEITKFPFDTVAVALELYKKIGLILTSEDNILTIINHKEMVGSETKWAAKKRLHESNKLPPLTSGTCHRANKETLILLNGKKHYIDEKRYGGNGAVAFDRAGCKCQNCGTEEDLLIHHNNGYSNKPEDLVILCKHCHGLIHSKKFNGIFSSANKICGGKTGGDFPPQSTLNSPDKSIEIRDKSIEIKDKDIKTKEKQEKEVVVVDSQQEVFVCYSDNIHPISGTIEIGRLTECIARYGPDIVKKAINTAVGQNKRTLSYVEGILRNWDTRGYPDKPPEKPKRKYDIDF